VHRRSPHLAPTGDEWTREREELERETHPRPGERPTPWRLVLDLGGVIFPSSMPIVLRRMSQECARSERQLKRFFNHQLRDDLWSGRMSEGEFWTRLLEFAGLPGREAEWSARMAEILEPQPVVERLPGWARRIAIVVLSNHRHEWAVPALERADVIRYLDRLLISSWTGRVKPYPEAFEPLVELGVPPERVLFVDDRPNNLRTAAELGVQTLFAGEGDVWMDEVERRIGPLPRELREAEATPGGAAAPVPRAGS
jgi:HAD superfamily hydrolase (TIGR01509 family)